MGLDRSEWKLRRKDLQGETQTCQGQLSFWNNQGAIPLSRTAAAVTSLSKWQPKTAKSFYDFKIQDRQ
jgi:hypothetical protein